jgi:hypothetical protein
MREALVLTTSALAPPLSEEPPLISADQPHCELNEQPWTKFPLLDWFLKTENPLTVEDEPHCEPNERQRTKSAPLDCRR